MGMAEDAASAHRVCCRNRGGACWAGPYPRMPSPLRGAEIGFLDDLFVDPTSRGQRIKRWDEMLRDHGRQCWPMIRWITRDNNHGAGAVTATPRNPTGIRMR